MIEEIFTYHSEFNIAGCYLNLDGKGVIIFGSKYNIERIEKNPARAKLLLEKDFHAIDVKVRKVTEAEEFVHAWNRFITLKRVQRTMLTRMLHNAMTKHF